MSRKLREISDSSVYHVMIRGIDGKDIFNDRLDKFQFLNSLIYYKNKHKIEIYSYCLMSNHVHLLLKDENENLSIFMKNLNGTYAMYFNSKYKRVGHLFQQRFKSINVENEEYFFEVVKYIHNNPVKAGICSIEDYRWSSYWEYVYKEKIINRKYLLEKLDSNLGQALKKFILFMKEDNPYNQNVYEIEYKLEDNEVKEVIKRRFNINRIIEINSYNKKERDKILKQLLVEKVTNVNQLSRILGVDRSIIRKL